MKRRFNFLLAPAVMSTTLLLTACGSSSDSSTPAEENDTLTAEQLAEQALGRKLFFDANLSSEGNQSCADCHDPNTGFADPVVTKDAPVSEGSVADAFGNRNAPTAAYAKFIPDFVKVTTTTLDGTISNYQGGQFLDGRATDLIEQAKGPFLNPVEMNNGEGLTGKTNVVNKVGLASYSDEFKAVYGATAFDDIEVAYNNIATAIAAFEESSEVSPFTSKFDAFRNGTASLTDSERRGMQIYMDGRAKCVNCHVISRPPRFASDSETVFSDFNYFNIGVPVNPANPSNEIDIGLAGNINIDAADIETEKGKFRTPTLRNIAETAPYMHNGVYQTLEEVIRHYDISVADFVDPEIDPLFFFPEVEANIAEELKVRLNLQPEDYTDLENFLRTLSDGFMQ